MNGTTSLKVRIYDGRRAILGDATNVFIRIIDGNQQERLARSFDQAELMVNDLPLFDNLGDNYTVLASKQGQVSAGYHPVKLSSSVVETVDLMLIPQPCRFNFDQARFAVLQQIRPTFCSILSGIAPDANVRFDALLENDPANDSFKGRLAADLLNILTAMQVIQLPIGTPLDYLKGIIWDGEHGLQPDRFYGWADPELVTQVKRAAIQHRFDPEVNPKFFHRGATSSYKENELGEANVQLTFHENDRFEVAGVNCIMVEPDIDYYRDLGSHGLLEVLPGMFPGGLTDPRMVYVLRWMAGRRIAGIPEFDPPYTIE